MYMCSCCFDDSTTVHGANMIIVKDFPGMVRTVITQEFEHCVMAIFGSHVNGCPPIDIAVREKRRQYKSFL